MPALPLSRYEFASVEEDECGRTFLDVPDPISKRVDRDDLRTVIGKGDEVGSLAWKFYKATLDPRLDVRPSSFFWVVAQFNDVVDVTEELPIGRIFRAPSLQRLVSEITVAPPFFSINESL